MTENPNDTPDSPDTPAAPPLVNTVAESVPARPRRSAASPLLLLVLLLAVAGGGGYGWQFLRTQGQQIEDLHTTLHSLESRVGQLNEHHGEVVKTAEQSAADIGRFAQRLDGYDQALGKLADQLQGGRTRFQLSAVESLLLSANERIQLQRDARGAATALELADQRLAGLAEPRLFKLREAIAQERSALLAVPQPDRTSAALTLASLIGRVSQLPLRARVPEHVEGARKHIPVPPDAGWLERLKAGAEQALGSVFNVRRSDGPAPRLLPPDQEALVYQILALKLEAARIAMLRDDATSYRDLCDASMRWLGDYFRSDDANVLAARAELERLKTIQLDTPLPDISRSLTLLRAYLDSAPQ